MKKQFFRPTFIDLNPDKLHYYPFIISINSCNGSCNSIEDPFGWIYAPNKMDDVNLKVFNMIKGINKSKITAEHNLCESR